MKLSIIIPVYNEADTISKVLQRVNRIGLNKEVIAVNDGSTDKTKEILEDVDIPNIKVLHHKKNMGKGAALATAAKIITGDIVAIQDADFEYNPEDLLTLVKPIAAGECEVMYGSRFLTHNNFATIFNRIGNKILTFITNRLFDANLTDMETCYKVMSISTWRKLKLTAKKFDIEPEITAQLLKLHIPIKEIPISYKGRSYHEGKKIGFLDGVAAIKMLLVYRFK